MSNILLNVNLQHKVLTTAGALPTIPSPTNITPTDSRWKTTDIMVGEWAYNSADNIWYYRQAGTIITMVAYTTAEQTKLAGLTLKEVVPRFVTVTDGATIAQDLESYLDTRGVLLATTRTATTLNLTGFVARGIFDLTITKNNTDQDLVFTLGGANLVYDVFDSANNVNTRATTVTISGTDSTQSWELNFKNTGIAEGGNTVIQVSGTIDAFA